MTTKKYKLTLGDIMQRSGIHKLTRDGFTGADIHKVLYREAGDATDSQRNKIITELYDRQPGEK